MSSSSVVHNRQTLLWCLTNPPKEETYMGVRSHVGQQPLVVYLVGFSVLNQKLLFHYQQILFHEELT